MSPLALHLFPRALGAAGQPELMTQWEEEQKPMSSSGPSGGDADVRLQPVCTGACPSHGNEDRE